MRNLLLGILIGIIITIGITNRGLQILNDLKGVLSKGDSEQQEKSLELRMKEASEGLLLGVFPDLRFHSIFIKPTANYMNESHDRLYNVTIKYERDGAVKEIQFYLTNQKKRFTLPSIPTIIELDNSAKVISAK